MSAKRDAKPVHLTKQYVSRLEAEVNTLGIYPRRTFHYIFDLIGFGLLSKAFALAKSCLLLIENGNADEAYGLSRTLVECDANLRYLTSDPEKQFERSMQFARFHYAEKRYWLECVRTHITDQELLEDAEKRAKEEDVEANENDPTKAVSKHWSGLSGFPWRMTELSHPLDGSTNDLASRKNGYAVDYHATSAYVHCSAWGLNNYYFDPGAPYEIRTSKADNDTTSQTLFIVCVHLYSCIAYVLFGLNVERPIPIQNLFSELIEALAADYRESKTPPGPC